MSSNLDPRTIVTPDAFSVAPELLGLPLAAPWRRLGSIIVDGILILLVGRMGGVFLGVVAGLFFLAIALGKSKLDRRMAWVFRTSMGCMGVFILLITSVVVFFLRFNPGADSLPENIANIGVATTGDLAGGETVELTLGGVLESISQTRDFRSAENAEEAENAVIPLVAELAGAGMKKEEIRDFVDMATPEDADWADDVSEILDRALASLAESGTEGNALSAEEAALHDEVASLTLDEVLISYARWIGVQDDEAEKPPRVVALESRILSAVASDTVGALEMLVSELEDDRDQARGDLSDTQSELAEARRGSAILNFIRQFADDLGLTFGWGSIYFAVLLPRFKGFTPGKKLFGCRIVRLDGQPITWFIAFERAGGYAAGVATGMLGFLQIYWDANRQAIHDKIAGTVVIRDPPGAHPIPGTTSGGAGVAAPPRDS